MEPGRLPAGALAGTHLASARVRLSLLLTEMPLTFCQIWLNDALGGASVVFSVFSPGSSSPAGKVKFPELKFKYVEEDQPEDFFIPYVWSLVFNSAVGLYWNSQGIELFSMDSA
ncbi:dymeclin isoform X1 [Tachysurus ichikawai]